MARARSGLAMLLLLAAGGCGARTELWVDADGGVAAPDQCTPIFEDCDGSAADCEEAFHRGCACGAPPAYLVAGPAFGHITMRDHRVRWTGEHFVVPINKREAPRVDVFDATGSRRLHSFSGYLRAVDGPTLHVGDNDPYEEAWIQAFDAATGESVGPPRMIQLDDLTPIGEGDLAGQRQTNRSIRPGREHQVYSGLVRAGEAGVAWTAVLPDLDWTTSFESVWNGAHVVSLHGDHVFLYEPYANEVTGPIRYRSPDRVGYTVYSPDRILLTDRGWLAIWSEVTLDHRADLVALALTASGEARGSVRRWHDREAPVTHELGRWIAQRPDGEVAAIYGRKVADRIERVMLRLDDEGRVLGRIGTPWRVGDRDLYTGIRSFLWAGYSYAVADSAFDEDGDYTGLRLQRVCP